ncbi:diguanylate cyclase domain-containing protein [Marinobacterium jannaschii]|uniref:diguanylate cyclase domain-containing protein n=1 Tax=Marinobacterium jannaschii TaxID=64970 RepID=UPI000484107E|nr:diguanylate cyclase [Marinobacterium jannaschii]
MRILIVDDDKLIRSILIAVIEDSGHEVVAASHAREALAILKDKPMDLVLTDVEMPDIDGFELTREIRRQHSNWFPIIFLSGRTDEAHLSKGIDAGGDDYLTKPISPVVLSAKIHAMERIAQMKSALDEANIELQRLNRIDSLTQVTNRHGLEQEMERAWRDQQRSQQELSMIMLDIDHFKLYNDNYGHQKGDECLKSVARILNGCLQRPRDLFARFGGEEFAAILPETPLEGARHLASRMLTQLEDANLPHEFSDSSSRVSVSIGVSSTKFSATSGPKLLQQADEALYAAKHGGRNRVICYGDKE